MNSPSSILEQDKTRGYILTFKSCDEHECLKVGKPQKSSNIIHQQIYKHYEYCDIMGPSSLRRAITNLHISW